MAMSLDEAIRIVGSMPERVVLDGYDFGWLVTVAESGLLERVSGLPVAIYRDETYAPTEVVVKGQRFVARKETG